jgi:hypothetical protein
MGIDTTLDLIFDVTYDYCNRGMFKELESLINSRLNSMDKHRVTKDELVGWLVATLPAASKLPRRKFFYDWIEGYLKLTCQWEDKLLDGLEGKTK